MQQAAPEFSPVAQVVPPTAVVQVAVAAHHPHSVSSEHSPHDVFCSQYERHVDVDRVNPELMVVAKSTSRKSMSLIV